MQEYYDACNALLGLELMHAFALALGLAENHFDACLRGPDGDPGAAALSTPGGRHYRGRRSEQVRTRILAA